MAAVPKNTENADFDNKEDLEFLSTTAEEHDCILFCSMSSNLEKRFLDTLDKPENQLQKAAHIQRVDQLKQSNWKSFETSAELNIGKEYGYFGVCYYRLDNDTKCAEIVFAHRGTCIDEKGNILADIAIAERQNPAIVTSAAFEYIKEAFGNRNFYDGSIPNDRKFQITISKQSYTITKITHTGFSLGGFIAGACAGLTNYPIVRAITFDAPGIGALHNKDTAKNRIINYVLKPNMVNTCNVHVGEVRELLITYQDLGELVQNLNFKIEFNNLGFTLPKAFTPEEQEQKSRMENFTRGREELDRTLVTHNFNTIDTIIKFMETQDGKPKYKKVLLWPVATNIVLYGIEPKAPHAKSPFKLGESLQNDFLFQFSNALGAVGKSGYLSDFITAPVEGLKFEACHKLWQVTKRIGNSALEEGVIGIEHKRAHKVFYPGEDQHLVVHPKPRSNSPKK